MCNSNTYEPINNSSPNKMQLSIFLQGTLNIDEAPYYIKYVVSRQDLNNPSRTCQKLTKSQKN
jgi:hypothetical protein